MEMEDLADTVRYWKIKACWVEEGEKIEKVRITYLLFGMCMVNEGL